MRETIAFVADSLWDGFQQTTWAGVSRASVQGDGRGRGATFTIVLPPGPEAA